MLSEYKQYLLEWITFDGIFCLFWVASSLGILLDGMIALYVDSPLVPQFMRTLVHFGKVGKEPKLNKQTERSFGEESNTWVVLCDGINSVLKKLEVPKSWFRHFYIYLLAVWCLVVFNLYISKSFAFFNNFSVGHLLLCVLFLQSCRRIYETHFVSTYSDNSINGLHYLSGILFYSSLGYVTYKSVQSNPSSNEFPTLRSWFFFIVFLFASYIQYQSHVILAKLRTEKSSKEPSRNSYHIPRSGLFQLIICPHYLAEIIIYISMYQITPYNGSISFNWLSIVIFVISNQLVASLVTHRWYCVKFGDKFSPKVKALIPFVL